jgi:hypothetical protein
VRRKGKYVNETFLRRKDAEEWALQVERRIDRGEPAIARGSRDAKTFGDLIKLHREDLQGIGKRIGRSKGVSLTFLEHRLGRLRIPELDRGWLIQFGKERASEGAGPVTVGIDLGYIKTIYRTRPPFMAWCFRSSRSSWRELRSGALVSSVEATSVTDGRRSLVAGFEFNPYQKIPLGRIIRFAVRPRCVRTNQPDRMGGLRPAEKDAPCQGSQGSAQEERK